MLAERLGGMTVEELLERMSAKEFSEWAYLMMPREEPDNVDSQLLKVFGKPNGATR